MPKLKTLLPSATSSAIIAGAAGTLAMDLVLYRRYRTAGGQRPFVKWEFSSVPPGFDDAPAPAKLGRSIAKAVGVDLPESSAGVVNSIVHWATGLGWGTAGSLASALPKVRALSAGVVTGVCAWGTSYVLLPKLDIYKPINEYDAKTLWQDLSAHLAFGATVGATTALLRSARRLVS